MNESEKVLIEKYTYEFTDLAEFRDTSIMREPLTRFRAELRAEWERELGEPVAWAWEWTENEGLTTKREIYTDREVVAVRAHMFGGVCVPLYALNVKWGE